MGWCTSWRSVSSWPSTRTWWTSTWWRPRGRSPSIVLTLRTGADLGNIPSNHKNICCQRESRVPGGGGHHGGGLLRLHQARHPGHTPYSIYLHLSIYSIYLLHLFIVVSICRWPCPGTRRTATSSPTESRATRSNKGLQKYFLAGWPV